MINVDLTGYCLINNEDAWTKYSLGFEQGTFPELLKSPKRKDLFARTWADKNGTERFSKNIFFESKTLSLPVFIVGSDKDDLANKYNAFKNFMETSGYFTLEFPDLGKNYKLLYTDMPDFNFETAYTKDGDVVARFKLSLTDDFPVSNSIFRSAFEAAKAAGYDVDENMFDQAVAADLPYSYMKEAEIILAPGIKKSGMVAGLDRSGNIVEFTATRAGTATYIGKDGLLKTAAANEPRVDYSTGSARYLLEPLPATNYLQYSNNLANAKWSSKTDTVCTFDAAKEESLVTISGPEAWVFQVVPVTAGSTYTMSFWIKKGTKNSGYKYHILDDDTRLIDIVPITSYDSQLKEGYNNVSVTFTIPATGVTAIRCYPLHEPDNAQLGTCVIRNVQIENGSVSSSAIITSGAMVTRVADIISTSFNSILDTGTLYANAITRGSISIIIKNTSNRIIALSQGKTQAIVAGTPTTQNSLKSKSIAAWGTSVKVGNRDGIQSGAYTAGSFLAANTWFYGSHILLATVALFDTMLPDDELQKLVS